MPERKKHRAKFLSIMSVKELRTATMSDVLSALRDPFASMYLTPEKSMAIFCNLIGRIKILESFANLPRS